MHMTNLEYSKEESFLNACTKANVKSSARQASKFRRKTGAVYDRAILGRKGVHVPRKSRINEDEY